MASQELENFIDLGVKLAKEKGYNPHVFIRMRNQYGTIESISRLVVSGEEQSGFKRLKKLGLLDYSIEAAVLKFPKEFSSQAMECAEFRLRMINSND